MNSLARFNKRIPNKMSDMGEKNTQKRQRGDTKKEITNV